MFLLPAIGGHETFLRRWASRGLVMERRSFVVRLGKVFVEDWFVNGARRTVDVGWLGGHSRERHGEVFR